MPKHLIKPHESPEAMACFRRLIRFLRKQSEAARDTRKQPRPRGRQASHSGTRARP